MFKAGDRVVFAKVKDHTVPTGKQGTVFKMYHNYVAVDWDLPNLPILGADSSGDNRWSVYTADLAPLHTDPLHAEIYAYIQRELHDAVL